MDTCKHVLHLNMLATDQAIWDTSKWQCSHCGTTESLWACLSCSNFGCGRTNEKHAAWHFESSGHPLAVEVNFGYVNCYLCDQYVMNDNTDGVINNVREALEAIRTKSPEEIEKEQGKLLRSYSHQQESSWNRADEDDKLVTAQCHYKKFVLAKVFTAWAVITKELKTHKTQETKQTKAPTTQHSPMLTRARSSLYNVKKRTLIPGVTGLRNLGNTCYINSVIQALGHLQEFREFFCSLVFELFSPSPSQSPQLAKTLFRLNTIDYFQHLSRVPSMPIGRQKKPAARIGGLNGGGTSRDPESVSPLAQAKAQALKGVSLCQELHGLLRVIWSGKWAQVSPHGFLQSVWRAIPRFKGHSQHDAQEFLCELLDKLSAEIQELPQCRGLENIVDDKFRGQLVSQVTCCACRNVSMRHEPFLDLSLEFPRRFQYTNSQAARAMCHITEMMAAFTDVEELEPQSYSCDKCNARRRRSKKGVKTDAKKQLLIARPPELLRLHLKRFRWCGRNNREKIGTHVAFDEELDVSAYCHGDQTEATHYRLSAVVVHHGAGFRAGHYTSYTYNTEAESWIHCNDSRIQLVSTKEVLLSQAYILFYTRQVTSLDDMPSLTPIISLDRHSTNTSLPELSQEVMESLRQGHTEHKLDDEVSFSFHRDPSLKRQISLLSSSDTEPSVEVPRKTRRSDPFPQTNFRKNISKSNKTNSDFEGGVSKLRKDDTLIINSANISSIKEQDCSGVERSDKTTPIRDSSPRFKRQKEHNLMSPLSINCSSPDRNLNEDKIKRSPQHRVLYSELSPSRSVLQNILSKKDSSTKQELARLQSEETIKYSINSNSTGSTLSMETQE